MPVTVERSAEEVTVSPGGVFEVTVTVTSDADTIYTVLEEPSAPDALDIVEASVGSPDVEVLIQEDAWVSAVTEANADALDLTYRATVTAAPDDELRLEGTVVTVDDEVEAGETTVTVQDDMPPIIGDDPPRDLDSDGLYEDVNGDGEFTIGDVQVFFQQRDSEPIQNNAAAFNFDESQPPEVTISDVQALFMKLVEQDAAAADQFADVDPNSLDADELASLLEDA